MRSVRDVTPRNTEEAESPAEAEVPETQEIPDSEILGDEPVVNEAASNDEETGAPKTLFD